MKLVWLPLSLLLAASPALADDAKPKAKTSKAQVEDPDDEDSDSVEVADNKAKPSVFVVEGNNQTVSHVCGGPESGATQVEVKGNNHVVTLTGPCTKLTVVGNGHTVTTEIIGSIQATGNAINVSWKKALSGERVQVKKTGNAIKIMKQDK